MRCAAITLNGQAYFFFLILCSCVSFGRSPYFCKSPYWLHHICSQKKKHTEWDRFYCMLFILPQAYTVWHDDMTWKNKISMHTKLWWDLTLNWIVLETSDCIHGIAQIEKLIGKEWRTLSINICPWPFFILTQAFR